MDQYKLLEKIGCGTFGVVYRAIHEESQEVRYSLSLFITVYFYCYFHIIHFS